MGVLAEQQRAAHVHVGDGSTHTEPNGEPDAGPNAAPVRRWLAQLRQGGRWHLLRDGAQQPCLRLQEWLLAEQRRAAHMHMGDGGTNAKPDAVADGNPDACAHAEPVAEPDTPAVWHEPRQCNY